VDFVVVQERPADLEASHIARAGLPMFQSRAILVAYSSLSTG
jgi:hypothetical protein